MTQGGHQGQNGNPHSPHGSDAPRTKRGALRDGWFVIVIAAASIWGQTPSFWGDDVISDLFRKIFVPWGSYIGVGILIGFAIVVANRVEKGDPIKEDLGLVVSILGLIVSVLGLFPELRDGVFAFVAAVWAGHAPTFWIF